MDSIDTAMVLDREQLREVTLDDQDLAREVVAALIDDTAQQIKLLESAIHNQDSTQCMRLAHYSKGACANLGAKAAAGVLKDIERKAADRHFDGCTTSLAALAQELDRLRTEAVAL